MIILDTSQIISASIYMGDALSCAQNPSESSKLIIKHSIINSIRQNYNTNKAKYGGMILACDLGSWRYTAFPEYKHSRKVKREADTSGINWDFVNEVKAELIDDLDKHFPFPVIYCRGVEGDDAIAVLTKHISEKISDSTDTNIFGEVDTETVLIISSDNDNFQLHTMKNVRQWSPMHKKLVRPDGDIKKMMIEKFICGESSDGIPNIICKNDHYVNPPEKRVVLTAKKKQSFIDAVGDGSIEYLPEYVNYKRNQELISYDKIPQDIQDTIMLCYNDKISRKHSKMGLYNYLVKNQMSNILSQINDFY